jgi:hypothetical protein
MSSSEQDQGQLIRGPEKVIWIKIPPPSANTKRVFFKSGTEASPHFGWFDLTGTKAFAWLVRLADSMASPDANVINVTWTPGSSPVNYQHSDVITPEGSASTTGMQADIAHSIVTSLV